MYHFDNYHFDIMVTPDHNNYIMKRNSDKFEFFKSTEVKKNYKMKTSIKWKGENLSLVDGYENNNFLKLLGLYLSEGWTNNISFYISQ